MGLAAGSDTDADRSAASRSDWVSQARRSRRRYNPPRIQAVLAARPGEHLMQTLGSLVALFVWVSASLSLTGYPADPAIPQAAGVPRGTPLFDGKTFNGWEGDLSIFRIQDGAIVGGSLENKIARNEFLCTVRRYRDFELRLKVKLLGGPDANAGVQFRTRRIPNDREVIGYQADLGQQYWGSLYDESRRKKTLASPDADTIKRVVKAGDWNDYVIRAEGKRIRLWLNGVQTVDYTEQDPSVEADGVIAVQIHAGPPTEAWYKDITLLDLAR